MLYKKYVKGTYIHYDGETYIDSEGKANTIINRFVSSPSPQISSKPTPDISQLTINIDGIFNLLTQIEHNKAAYPDEIPPRLLKETAYEMILLLISIFQPSLDQGKIRNQPISCKNREQGMSSKFISPYH